VLKTPTGWAKGEPDQNQPGPSLQGDVRGYAQPLVEGNYPWEGPYPR
jgi:hypothetical protein